MILTVNLGNTHITIGGYEHDDLKFCGRLHTDPAATVDEYGLRLLNLLSLHGASPEQIEGGILGSVVPALTGRVLAALQMLCPVRILTVGPGLKSGIRLRLDNPAQLGAELLCGAVAALAEGSGPLVVISADTAISLMAVNGKQELVGGVILPGPQLSLAALVQNTAQLPQIDLSAPAPASVLGKNTAACLQNGFVLGTAGMLDGLDQSSLKGALMSRGTREIARLIESMGGNGLSAYGLCHLGDYQATLFSQHSHNRRFGELFIRHEPYGELAEGASTVRALCLLGQRLQVDLPICQAVDQVVHRGEDPSLALSGLFLRTLKNEF